MLNFEFLEAKRRPRGRPSAVQAAELRESFLAAALQSFLEKGYAATSIEAISRDAGVAKITIYRQFENKQALFHEVVHRAVSNARNTMQATVVREGADERELLLDLVERMYLGATEPETLALLRLVIAEAGRLNVPSPELAAVQLSTLAFGGVRFFISKPLAGPAERRVWAEAIVDLVLCGWAPQPVRNATLDVIPAINA